MCTLTIIYKMIVIIINIFTDIRNKQNLIPMQEIQTILHSTNISKDDKENASYELANILIKEQKYDELCKFCQSLRKLWPGLTGARASKIMKKITFLIPTSDLSKAIIFIEKMIEWCDKEGIKYLKLYFQTKRVGILFELRDFTKCLKNIKILNIELKKMNDKINLINLYIYESKTFYEMQNLTRAKASLTSARALAVTTYSPFYVQAQIELLAGMYICEDRNYSTAHANFMEALDGFHQTKMTNEALIVVRYLVLSKIIIGKWTDLNGLLKSKNVVPYIGDNIVKILLQLSEACKKRNLSEFDSQIRENYEKIRDNFILSHLTHLKELLLDANILKLLEPYLNVSISFLADKLNFPVQAIESKLRAMILDKKISGILDYYTGTLVLYEKQEATESEKNYLKMTRIISNSIKSNAK